MNSIFSVQCEAGSPARNKRRAERPGQTEMGEGKGQHTKAYVG